MINKSRASWLLHALIQLQPGDYYCILPSTRQVSLSLSLSLRLTIEWEGPSLVSKYYRPTAQCFQTVSNCNSEKFSRSGPIIKQSEGAATVLGSIIFHQNSNKISTASNQPAPVVWPSPVKSSGTGNNHLWSGRGQTRQPAIFLLY